MSRYLFVIPTSALSGGIKVILEIGERLQDRGHEVEVFSFAGIPKWRTVRIPFVASSDLSQVKLDAYDFVLVSNAFLLPFVLGTLTKARGIFFCQDWESFHHGNRKSFESFMQESPTFVKIYQLPMPIIATSKAIVELIKERAARSAYFMPLAIDKTIFTPKAPRSPGARHRIMFVGNYLMPYKGMAAAKAALCELSKKYPIEMVVVTQEVRGREFFSGLPYPVEIHTRPTEKDMPGIYESCDIYACCSWYEGFGLPAIEAFRCGRPVVSTKSRGVSDYGKHESNLLLAEPNNPQDLAFQLERLIKDQNLAQRLVKKAFDTVNAYDWEASCDAFLEAIAKIDSEPRAVNPDSSYLSDLIGQLEAEGNLTPPDVFRMFERLSQELSELLKDMSQIPKGDEKHLARLREIRHALAAKTANPKAEYYSAFKSKLDLCDLVIALSDEPDLSLYLERILNPLPTSMPETEEKDAASFSEIVYTKP